jgi:hypothetical protein
MPKPRRSIPWSPHWYLRLIKLITLTTTLIIKVTALIAAVIALVTLASPLIHRLTP